MRLAAKLVFVLLLGVFVLTAIRVYFALAQEESEFANEMSQEAAHLSMSLEKVLGNLGHRWGNAAMIQGSTLTVRQEKAFQLKLVDLKAAPGDPDAPLVAADQIKKLFAEGRQWLRVRDASGEMHVCLYLPLDIDGEFCLLEAMRPATQLQHNKLMALYHNVWVAAGSAVIAVLLVGLVGVRLVGRPVQRLVEKTRRIAAGDLFGPVHLNSRDELNELAESINDMCARLAESQQQVQQETAARIQAMEQLRHTDRLRTVGRLAAGVAHELGTPLNVVSGRAGLIASGKLSETETAQSATTIKAETDRMTAIIRKLLDFARRSTPLRSPADLCQVARETADLLSALARKSRVDIVVRSADTPLSAPVDVGQIQQVLTNLIVNAIQAMPQGGRVEVELSPERAVSRTAAGAGETDFVRLSVKDEGCGIAAEHLDQVFEPFFTTKDVGEGTGLGLSIVYGIVQEHGGWIDVASQLGHGSCFSVHLPQESPA